MTEVFRALSHGCWRLLAAPAFTVGGFRVFRIQRTNPLGVSLFSYNLKRQPKRFCVGVLRQRRLAHFFVLLGICFDAAERAILHVQLAFKKIEMCGHHV